MGGCFEISSVAQHNGTRGGKAKNHRRAFCRPQRHNNYWGFFVSRLFFEELAAIIQLWIYDGYVGKEWVYYGSCKIEKFCKIIRFFAIFRIHFFQNYVLILEKKIFQNSDMVNHAKS